MKIENVFRIIQWGYGDGARNIPMFVTALPAKLLAEKAKIFRRTPDRRDGYQRKLADSRLGKGKLGIAGYILNQMGVFPTSILVNIRRDGGDVTFTSKQKISDRVELGDLLIPNQLDWYVMDGQHRVEGLKIAMREKPDLEDYPTIVTITNESIFYEMLMFYIVNDRAKRVPTDLVYRILQQMHFDEKSPKWVAKEILTKTDRRKAVAAEIVDHLNSMKESPFKDKIQEVGEIRKPEHLVQDGTMTRYIAMILREQAFDMMEEEEVARLLSQYWAAVARVYANAFMNPDEYMILGTLGISSLTRLFPTIYSYCAKDGDVSDKRMEHYLRFLFEQTNDHHDVDFRRPIDMNWWHRVDGPGIIKGTGEGLYQEVARKLAEKVGIVLKAKRGGKASGPEE